MKERFQRFMYGRYGADELSKVMVWGVLVCFIVTIFTSGWVDTLFNVLGWVLLIFGYFRMFSKNHSKRWAENQKFLSLKYQILGKVNRQKGYQAQKKTHRIYKCPGCGQKIRVPKGKGKIEISCPKCRTAFIKRT